MWNLISHERIVQMSSWFKSWYFCGRYYEWHCVKRLSIMPDLFLPGHQLNELPTHSANPLSNTERLLSWHWFIIGDILHGILKQIKEVHLFSRNFCEFYIRYSNWRDFIMTSWSLTTIILICRSKKDFFFQKWIQCNFMKIKTYKIKAKSHKTWQYRRGCQTCSRSVFLYNAQR